MTKVIKTRLMVGLIMILLLSGIAKAAPEFIYVNNVVVGSNTISGYSISVNGALSPIPGSPFQTGGSGFTGYYSTTQILVVGNFLYAVNSNSKNISGFSINPMTGFLTPVPGSPFSIIGISFGIPMSIAATPDGRFLYADNADSITGYRIEPNGSLTTIPESPFNLGGDVFDSMKVTSDGKFLLLGDYSQLRALMVFAIGPTGLLTPVLGAPFAFTLPGIAAGIDVNCTSNLVFVGAASITSASVAVLSMTPDGRLAQIADSPFIPGVGINSGVVHLSPDERHLFVSNQDSNDISVYDVAPSGSISLVSGSPFPIAGASHLTHPAQMVTSSSGTFLYTAVYPNLINAHSINSNGSLTAISGSPFSNGYQSFQSNLISIAAYPGKTCGPAFDTCIQDDSSGNILQINSTTGDYRFSDCLGLVISGTGSLVTKGSITTLQHYSADRRVSARLDGASGRATASIQLLSLGRTFVITDRNISNNSCACS